MRPAETPHVEFAVRAAIIVADNAAGAVGIHGGHARAGGRRVYADGDADDAARRGGGWRRRGEEGGSAGLYGSRERWLSRVCGIQDANANANPFRDSHEDSHTYLYADPHRYSTHPTHLRTRQLTLRQTLLRSIRQTLLRLRIRQDTRSLTPTFTPTPTGIRTRTPTPMPVPTLIPAQFGFDILYEKKRPIQDSTQTHWSVLHSEKVKIEVRVTHGAVNLSGYEFMVDLNSWATGIYRVPKTGNFTCDSNPGEIETPWFKPPFTRIHLSSGADWAEVRITACSS